MFVSSSVIDSEPNGCFSVAVIAMIWYSGPEADGGNIISVGE
jgi:hypothetical protein